MVLDPPECNTRRLFGSRPVALAATPAHPRFALHRTVRRVGRLLQVRFDWGHYFSKILLDFCRTKIRKGSLSAIRRVARGSFLYIHRKSQGRTWPSGELNPRVYCGTQKSYEQRRAEETYMASRPCKRARGWCRRAVLDSLNGVDDVEAALRAAPTPAANPNALLFQLRAERLRRSGDVHEDETGDGERGGSFP